MAILLDSVAPLVKMISLGSAPIKSATCCRKRNADLRPCDKTQRIHHSKAPFSRIHRRASKGPQAALLPPPSTAASRLRYGRSLPQRTAALPAGPARTHPPGALGGGLALPSVRVGAGVRVPVAAGQVGQHAVQHPRVLRAHTALSAAPPPRGRRPSFPPGGRAAGRGERAGSRARTSGVVACTSRYSGRRAPSPSPRGPAERARRVRGPPGAVPAPRGGPGRTRSVRLGPRSRCRRREPPRGGRNRPQGRQAPPQLHGRGEGRPDGPRRRGAAPPLPPAPEAEAEAAVAVAVRCRAGRCGAGRARGARAERGAERGAVCCRCP